MDVQAILPFEARRALRMILPQSLLNWREAKFYGRYGEVELHLLKFLCRRDADAIDVGANDGSYVHYLRRHAHKVVAFEPMPVLASALRKKFPGGEVVIEQVALSDRADTVELHMPVVDGIVVTGCSTISTDASGTYPATQAIKVSIDRLDAAYKGRAGFIKIDVEGHEQAVLDGALQTIRRCRPRVLVEIDDRLSPGGLARARTYFDSLGYTGHYVRKGKLEPISTFSVEEMQRPDRLPDLIAPLTERKRFGAYIYNFIFLPAEEPTSTVQRISAHLRTL